MQIVTPEQLIQALLAHPVKGAKCCAIITRTRPKMLVKSRVTKEPNPFPQGVERVALRQVTLGASYEKAVNRQRLAENHDEAGQGGFVAESLWNGQGEKHSAYTVRHRKTGRIYLAVKPAQAQANTPAGSAAVVVRDQWSDVATGRELDFETDRLAEFMPVQGKSNTQDVEQDVLWRTVALDSIEELRYGETYQVLHEAHEGARS